MFSQTTEYALRAAVYLAGIQERSVTATEMAQATKVPPSYLSKVLQTLVRAGLVRALRGLHGGYRLGRPAAEISVLDVVNAVDPLSRIRVCPLGLPEHQRLCPLHQEIDDAMAQVERQLAQKPIAELVEVSQVAWALIDKPPSSP